MERLSLDNKLLKPMKEKLEKSNTEKKLEYLAILENSLK